MTQIKRICGFRKYDGSGISCEFLPGLWTQPGFMRSDCVDPQSRSSDHRTLDIQVLVPVYNVSTSFFLSDETWILIVFANLTVLSTSTSTDELLQKKKKKKKTVAKLGTEFYVR